MPDYVKISQMLTLLLGIGSIIYILVWAHSAQKWWNFTVPIFLYLVHQSVFYAMVLYSEIVLGTKLDDLYHIPRLGENWSAILRTHGTITILFAVITVKFQILRFFRREFLELLDNDTNTR